MTDALTALLTAALVSGPQYTVSPCVPLGLAFLPQYTASDVLLRQAQLQLPSCTLRVVPQPHPPVPQPPRPPVVPQPHDPAPPVTTVPEPNTLALLLGGACLWLVLNRAFSRKEW